MSDILISSNDTQFLLSDFNSKKLKKGLSRVQIAGIGLLAASTVVGAVAIALFILFQKTGSINVSWYKNAWSLWGPNYAGLNVMLKFSTYVPKKIPLLYAGIAVAILTAGFAAGGAGLLLKSEFIKVNHKKKLAIGAITASVIVALIAISLFIAYHRSNTTLLHKVVGWKVVGYNRELPVYAVNTFQIAYAGPKNVNFLRGSIATALVAAALAAGGTSLLIPKRKKP